LAGGKRKGADDTDAPSAAKVAPVELSLSKVSFLGSVYDPGDLFGCAEAGELSVLGICEEVRSNRGDFLGSAGEFGMPDRGGENRGDRLDCGDTGGTP